VNNNDIKRLLNAVIKRVVLDAMGKELSGLSGDKNFRKMKKELLQAQAKNYIKNDQDFKYICEMANINMNFIRNGVTGY
jgi:hypothetical protein